MRGHARRYCLPFKNNGSKATRLRPHQPRRLQVLHTRWWPWYLPRLRVPCLQVEADALLAMAITASTFSLYPVTPSGQLPLPWPTLVALIKSRSMSYRSPAKRLTGQLVHLEILHLGITPIVTQAHTNHSPLKDEAANCNHLGLVHIRCMHYTQKKPN